MISSPDFEALYRHNADPWRVASSYYERRKLDIVVASLLRHSYRFAWDPACGTGHLAARLAERADRVVATDRSATAVGLTAEQCRNMGNVTSGVNQLPAAPETVQGMPDLVIFSEFFYYLNDVERAETLAMLDTTASPTCELVAVHWRHVPSDAWLGGAGAQQEIVGRLGQRGWAHRLHHDDEEFVIDTVERGTEE